MGKIKTLTPEIIGRIAAGEIIEGPAHAIKELIENALDAQATRITVRLRQSGLAHLSVEDDGEGMGSEDLRLCTQRHATSKLMDTQLKNLPFYGFRGEALPALQAAGRLSLTSYDVTQGTAFTLTEGEIKPAALNQGTIVTVDNIFSRTPARLQFLHSQDREKLKIYRMVKRYALAHPSLSFFVYHEEQEVLSFPALSSPQDTQLHRLKKILGPAFGDNHYAFDETQQDYRLQGWGSIPTIHKGHAQDQYFFVQKRWIIDKLLSSLVRSVYRDVIPGQRYPLGVMFLTLPPEDVDVNVHPHKTEVRWKDPQRLRRLLYETLTPLVHQSQENTHHTLSALQAFHPGSSGPKRDVPSQAYAAPSGHTLPSTPLFPEPDPVVMSAPPKTTTLLPRSSSAASSTLQESSLSPSFSFPLGKALGQIDGSFIVAENAKGLVIIDQHAAHERLVYETLKESLKTQGYIPSSPLLLPEVFSLSQESLHTLSQHLDHWTTLGFSFTVKDTKVIVTHIPAILKSYHLLLEDMLDTALTGEETPSPQDMLHHIYGNMACRSSIKARNTLTLGDMNYLLRWMESTPCSDQCNHGRPTWIQLPIKKIAHLFERS